MELPYLYLVLAFVVVLALYAYKKYNGSRLVGVPRVSMIKYRKDPTAVTAALTNAALTEKAKLVVLDFPFMPIALVTHPDTARDLLKNDEMFPKGSLFTNGVFGSLFVGSLVNVNGDHWKHQRSTMSPAFHFDYLRGLVPMLRKKSGELIDQFPKGEPFDVKSYLYHFTVDVLGLAAFGVDFKTMTEGNKNEYYRAYEDLSSNARMQLSNPIPMWIRERLPLEDVKKSFAAKATLLKMTQTILERRRADSEKHYLVDMMLEAQPALSNQELQANTFLFFLAGHETTASALSWALYLLAEHPDKQARVREEVDRVLAGKHVEADQLKDLIYLDMFIKEVMRYGSPIPFVGSRVTSEDTYVGDTFVPKNTPIGLSIHSIHHNPEFWPNPEVFNPDRFELSVKQHPFAFLPFSLGKRVCIGNNFSLIEQKIFLTMLLQRYEVQKGENWGELQFDPKAIARVPLHVNLLLKNR